jgi:hypothetical protein
LLLLCWSLDLLLLVVLELVVAEQHVTALRLLWCRIDIVVDGFGFLCLL